MIRLSGAAYRELTISACGVVLAVVDYNYRPMIAGALLVGLTVAEIAGSLPDSGFLAAWERSQRVLFSGKKTYVSVAHPFADAMFCGFAEIKDGNVVVRLFMNGGFKACSEKQSPALPVAIG